MSHKKEKSAVTPTQLGKKTNPERGKSAKKKDIGLLIEYNWALVEEAKAKLRDPRLKESEKIRWAGILANSIGTLNKLLWKAGQGRVNKEDLAKLLEKIPKKYARIVKKRLKPNFPTQSELIEKIKALKYGEPIEIVWLDASETRGATAVTNRVVATHRRLIGWFHSLANDERTGILHLLTYHQTTDYDYDIDSTPLPMILDIKRIPEKRARKKFHNAMKTQWTQSLPGGGVKHISRKLIKSREAIGGGK